jgi:hypothetical protein
LSQVAAYNILLAAHHWVVTLLAELAQRAPS